MKHSDIVPPQGRLGIDLPDTEDELFEIDKYPLFDEEVGFEIFGDVTIVRKVLKSFEEDNIGYLRDIRQSHKVGNWIELQRLVHKLKNSALYGTVRLYFAILFLERYLKTCRNEVKEQLYNQLIDVWEKTVTALREEGILPR